MPKHDHAHVVCAALDCPRCRAEINRRLAAENAARRTASMTPAARSQAARQAARARWRKSPTK